MRLANKVAIVTGAGNGIGRGIALALASEGAHVVVNDVQEDKTRNVASEIQSIGGEALAVKADVRSCDEVSKMVEKTLQRFGRIDILVNNAGVCTTKRAIDLTEHDDWDFVMDVNAKGTFLCNVEVAKQMIKQGGGGKIVNISSVGGKTGGKFGAHYCASKFAVIGWTQSLARELTEHKINVNAVCPDIVRTSMIRRNAKDFAGLTGKTEEEVNRDWGLVGSELPMGSCAEPADVAKVVVFLCTSDTDYMTGQSINVSQGLEVH